MDSWGVLSFALNATQHTAIPSSEWKLFGMIILKYRLFRKHRNNLESVQQPRKLKRHWYIIKTVTSRANDKDHFWRLNSRNWSRSKKNVNAARKFNWKTTVIDRLWRGYLWASLYRGSSKWPDATRSPTMRRSSSEYLAQSLVQMFRQSFWLLFKLLADFCRPKWATHLVGKLHYPSH